MFLSTFGANRCNVSDEYGWCLNPYFRNIENGRLIVPYHFYTVITAVFIIGIIMIIVIIITIMHDVLMQ